MTDRREYFRAYYAAVVRKNPELMERKREYARQREREIRAPARAAKAAEREARMRLREEQFKAKQAAKAAVSRERAEARRRAVIEAKRKRDLANELHTRIVNSVRSGMTYSEAARVFGLPSRNVVAGIVNRYSA